MTSRRIGVLTALRTEETAMVDNGDGTFDAGTTTFPNVTVGLVVCVLAILQAMLVVMAAEFVRMRAEAHLETAEERAELAASADWHHDPFDLAAKVTRWSGIRSAGERQEL